MSPILPPIDSSSNLLHNNNGLVIVTISRSVLYKNVLPLVPRPDTQVLEIRNNLPQTLLCHLGVLVLEPCRDRDLSSVEGERVLGQEICIEVRGERRGLDVLTLKDFGPWSQVHVVCFLCRFLLSILCGEEEGNGVSERENNKLRSLIMLIAFEGGNERKKTLNKRLTAIMAASEKTVPLNPVSIPKIPLICAFTASWSNGYQV